MGIEIHGACEPRFAAVREEFAEGFRTRTEVGAAVAVTLDGAPVVDLWAGHADQARTRPWRRETIVNIYSCTKALTALCAHQLVERGQLDLDAPVASYWPEFAQAAKAGIPLRWLLSHLPEPQSAAALAFVNPPTMAFGPNTPEGRRAEIPGANGHGAARDLARLYGALARGGTVDGVHVLAPDSIARGAAEQSYGPDLVLQVPTRFGLGFMLTQERVDARFGPSRRAFGHPGAGGSLGFADPDHRVGF